MLGLDSGGRWVEHREEGVLPCSLCVSEWSHWIAVVKEEKGNFILLTAMTRRCLSSLPGSSSRAVGCIIWLRTGHQDAR